MFKKAFTAILLTVALLAVFCATRAETAGACGDLDWTLDAGGVLTITGNGAIVRVDANGMPTVAPRRRRHRCTRRVKKEAVFFTTS